MYSPLSDADETEEPVERLGDSEGDPCIDIPPERVSEENPYSNIIPKEDPHSNGPQEDSYSNSHQEDPCTYNTEENPCIESRPDGVVDTSTPEPNEPFDSDMATPLIEPSRPLHGIDIGDGTLSKIKDRIRERKSKVEVPNASSGMLEAMIQWLRSYYDSLFRITFILLLLLIERVVQDKLFVCPCKSTQLNRVYSIAFMVVPAIVLFGSAILLNNMTWRAVTGCIARHKYGRYGCRNWCRVLCRLLPGALTAPYVWIVFAFLDGRFYSCMIKNGDTCSLSTLELREMQMEVVVLHTDSQLIGYGLLFLGLLVCFIYMCISQMTNPLPYEHQKYVNVFEDEFAIQKDVLIREFTRSTLRRDIKDFIDDVLAEEGDVSGDDGDHRERSRTSTLEDLKRLGLKLDEGHDRAVGSFRDIKEEDEEPKGDSFPDSKPTKDRHKGDPSRHERGSKKKRNPFRPYWRHDSHGDWESITRPIFVEHTSPAEGGASNETTENEESGEKKEKKLWKWKRDKKGQQGDIEEEPIRKGSIV